MTELPQRIYRPGAEKDGLPLSDRNWLVTNGMGGYASGTLADVDTWRYHGLLIAAEAAPLGRTMLLKHLTEEIKFTNGQTITLTGQESEAGSSGSVADQYLQEFRLEGGLPVWVYKADGLVFERRILMPHHQNTVYISYKVLQADGPVGLNLHPWMRFRSHDATLASDAGNRNYALHILGNQYEVSAGPDMPTLRLYLYGGSSSFITNGGIKQDFLMPQDASRGYDARDVAWNPGHFALMLTAGQEVSLIASTEDWPNLLAVNPAEAMAYERERRLRLVERAAPQAREGIAAELVLAADQFIFEPAGRLREKVRARAMDDFVRAVIAGYYWFTDWGRDTMISLEGLTLVTGRSAEAAWVLRAINRYVKDGLIPNLFPEGQDDGLYHTADATLWYFHAIDRYITYTNDRETLKILLPNLVSIAEHHLKGTRFNIHVDKADGLLAQGEEGYQLTWMDAKVDDWVVTPRRGKAVEINALWYNALCLLAQWLSEEGRTDEAATWRAQAEQAKTSFNARFWYEGGGYLYDVIDGENGSDSACRPNQLIAFSLRYPILERERWEAVLKIVRNKLLTPVGLRSLSPDHPDYRAKYFGNLRARDAAYHQGTVWPWLIGLYVDCHLALHPDDRAGARRALEGFQAHMDEACIGSVSEICDAEAPYISRGCISQAWSVAEVLRCWVKTEPIS